MDNACLRHPRLWVQASSNSWRIKSGAADRKRESEKTSLTFNTRTKLSFEVFWVSCGEERNYWELDNRVKDAGRVSFDAALGYQILVAGLDS